MIKCIAKEVPNCQHSLERRPLRSRTETGRKKRRDGKKVGRTGSLPTCSDSMPSHFNKLNEDIAFRQYHRTLQTPGFQHSASFCPIKVIVFAFSEIMSFFTLRKTRYSQVQNAKEKSETCNRKPRHKNVIALHYCTLCTGSV